MEKPNVIKTQANGQIYSPLPFILAISVLAALGSAIHAIACGCNIWEVCESYFIGGWLAMLLCLIPISFWKLDAAAQANF